MKTCSICKETKPLLDFGRDRHKRDGLTTTCKPCSKLVRNGYRQPPRPTITEKVCKECSTLKPIADYYKHSCICKSCISIKNANKRITVPKVYSTAVQSVYKRTRRKSDSLFKLRSNIGTAIANSLANKGFRKSTSTVSILGCSLEQFKTHIESQFLTGMTWDNRHLWHIDHIVPLRLATTESQVLLLNHYSNLRPLWSLENQQKAGSITEDVKNHPLYTKLYTP